MNENEGRGEKAGNRAMGRKVTNKSDKERGRGEARGSERYGEMKKMRNRGERHKE